ncbi:MAG TPA: aspartate kinase [Chloroflexota bacterium]|nr:aspartate kinase [Chloroflexota bacterium]
MKFGGSSLADAGRIRRVAELVRRAGREPGAETPVVVVSAMGGVTDRLFALARVALGGRSAQGAALEQVEELRRHHEQALAEICGEARDVSGDVLSRLDAYFAELRDIVIGVSLLGELSPRSLDAIASYGEKLSTLLSAAALRVLGTPAAAISAEEVVVTDATFGSAVPDMEATTRRAAEQVVPLARQGIVPVVTGYIGATPEGVTTTLGRNGSDYSAAIVGAAVGAEEIWIWTDVDGVMTADPRLVPSARSLPDLSYAEAAELAYFGSKVIHPRTIVPAVAAGVPIRIKNTFNPDHPGTLIAASSSHAVKAVKAVTVIRDLALVTVEGLGMLGVPGIAGRTFGAMATAGVNVLMISQASSESNIAFVVAQREVATAVAALREAFALELHRHEVDAIRAQEGVAIVTAVGGDMRGTPGVAGRLFGALGNAGVNVIAIAQGSSELSISCTVLDSAVVDALRAVHEEFVEGTR